MPNAGTNSEDMNKAINELKEEAKLFDRFEHSIETEQAGKPMSEDDKEFGDSSIVVAGPDRRNEKYGPSNTQWNVVTTTIPIDRSKPFVNVVTSNEPWKVTPQVPTTLISEANGASLDGNATVKSRMDVTATRGKTKTFSNLQIANNTQGSIGDEGAIQSASNVMKVLEADSKYTKASSQSPGVKIMQDKINVFSHEVGGKRLMLRRESKSYHEDDGRRNAMKAELEAIMRTSSAKYGGAEAFAPPAKL